MNNTIIKKSYVNIRDEKVAAGVITPGMLVERLAADTVQAHSTNGGEVNKLFAVEDSLQGNEITDDYAIGDQVSLWHPVPGEVVYAIIDSTSTANRKSF